MAHQTNQDHRQYVSELAQIECVIVRGIADELGWITQVDEFALRWALSLARVSTVLVPGPNSSVCVDIGHATDIYRQHLYTLLSPLVSTRKITDRAGLIRCIPKIRTLVAAERKELIDLYRNHMPAAALDNAVRRRPLVLAMGGGGGTSYVFTGALGELEEAGIRPNLIAGTSMGAILGAYRARQNDFSLAELTQAMMPLTWDKIAQPLHLGSRFGVPSTFRLYLREVFGHEFERDGEFLRLCDLAIPLIVAVAGIAHIEGQPDLDLSSYEHLLDNITPEASVFRQREKGITRALLDLAAKPLRPIYLGRDDLTKEFDVLDAVGFSAAVPGLFHYDILRDDPRMIGLVTEVMRRHGVIRLIDGGFIDNLPAAEAKRAVQAGAIAARDPFVLALDGFAPSLHRHWLFLPVMRIAAENSREGRAAAHLTITYRHVLSPLNIIPSRQEFARAMANGRSETSPHIPFIRKMLGPIPDPPGVVSEMDGQASVF